MSKRNQTIEYRGRNIRRVGNQWHAFVDKVEQSYPELQRAKDAIDEMLERRDQVERTVGALRSHPYEEAKRQYFMEMQAKGLSEATQRNYGTFFRQLEKVETLKHTKDITTELISKFLSKFIAQGTKHTNYMNVRGFVGFCLSRNYLIDRKILDLEISPGVPTNGKRQMTSDELKRTTEWMEKRKSVLKLLWRVATETGLRTGEAVHLLRTNLNVETRTIIISARKTKGRKRVLMVSAETVRLLQEHMATCQSIYLVSLQGERYTEGAIQSLVKRMRNELNLPKDIAFYSLRKGVSNHAYDLGGPALEAQMLGHSTAVALSNYVQVKPEMAQMLLDRTMVGGRNVSSSVTKESVEQYINQMAKTDREWVKGLMMKAL